MEEDSVKSFIWGVMVGLGILWAAHTWGGLWHDTNEVPIFGKTGLPRNCRAIVQVNVDGWHSGSNTAEGALNSIERNCGTYGYSWGLK